MEIESTVRYLGIEVDDAIEIAEKIGILTRYPRKQTWSAMNFASPIMGFERTWPPAFPSNPRPMPLEQQPERSRGG